MALEISLLAKVEPGSVTTNFSKFKEALQLELETNYNNIVVTDEGLQFARDARANLNKAKTQLKQIVKKAKEDNAVPLEAALQQAKELEALLDNSILILDGQIKKIEEARKEACMTKAKGVLEQMLKDNGNPDVTALVSSCEWAINPKWENTTYTYAQIRKDCEAVISKATQALELLQGDFQTDMLQHFREHGDLGAAQIYGNQLQKQFNEAEKRKAERLEREAAAEKEEQVVQPDIPPRTESYSPVSEIEKTIQVKDPASYRDKGEGLCNATFKIYTRRYKMHWLLDLCKDQHIDMVRLDK